MVLTLSVHFRYRGKCSIEKNDLFTQYISLKNKEKLKKKQKFKQMKTKHAIQEKFNVFLKHK